MALGSTCQTPAEARRHYDARQTQYNNGARQRWEQNQAALMRRNRQIQGGRYNAGYRNNNCNNNINYNNRDHHHHGHDNR